MGVGNVGCCDNTTALKNTEISIQSVTFRENSEDYYFASNTLIIPQSDNEIEFANLTKRIKRLKKLVKFPKLSLRFLSPAIEQALLVSPTGLFPSKRSSEDGYVFFGTKYKLNGSIVNDFKLPIQDSDKTKNVPGRYFMVYYDLKKSSYWIKDLGKGPGLFIKLDYALLMKDGMVLNIGNSYLQFNFTTKINSNPEVQVRKLGDENYQV